MDEFLEKIRKNGTLMGRYQINGENVYFASASPAVTGSIRIGDEKATVSQQKNYLRIEYEEVEIFLAPDINNLKGTFTAGILEVILKTNTKILSGEILAALKTVMPQKS